MNNEVREILKKEWALRDDVIEEMSNLFGVDESDPYIAATEYLQSRYGCEEVPGSDLDPDIEINIDWWCETCEMEITQSIRNRICPHCKGGMLR